MSKTTEILNKIARKRSLLEQVSTSKNRLEAAKLQLEIGWAFREKGAVTNDVLDYREAREQLKTAFEMCQLVDEHFLMGKAKYFLGIVEGKLSELTGSHNLIQAIRCFDAALEYFDACGEPRWWSLVKFKLGNAWYFNHDGDYLSNLNTSICHFRDALSAAHVGQWKDDIDDIENNMCIAEIKRARLLRPNPPTCFISYAWEDPDHKNWVRTLAEELHSYGVRMRLDQWDEADMYDIPKYMETSIRESDYVLLVCTPLFASKANTGVGGVGYEKYVITGEIFTRTSERSKFIPLLKSGGPESAIPSYLKGALYYDFSGSTDYRRALHSLLRRLFEIPRHTRPHEADEVIRDTDLFEDNRRYRIEYVDDPDFPSDFFERVSCLDDGPVTLDARYRLASFTKKMSSPSFDIVNIEIDRTRSNWYADPRLLQRYSFDAKYENGILVEAGIDSFHPELEQYYKNAAWHFQQGNPDKAGRKIKDPVLDVTLLNTDQNPVVVSSIGVCPLALWAIPKMIYQPKVIPRFDVFFLRCNFEKLLCNIALTDPIYVPAGSPFRFTIALIDYAEEILRFQCNESAIAFVLNGTQDRCFVSKTIYLGVTG